MQKTIFRITKMDCPSEEQMIRMRLADMDNVDKLDFDLAARMLTVYHSGTHDEILKRLDGLQLNTSLVSSNETEQDIHLPDDHTTERKLLIQVLIINLSFFILELITGYVASSMGLIADGLDMLADSIVYALALMAVGSTMVRKKKIATLAGYFQLLLAIVGFAEVVRRFTGTEENPAFLTMILVSVLALMGNALCLYILQKSKSKEAHMRASMIFTSNDVIVNAGVILAGVLVYFTGSAYPDLVIGSIVFVMVAVASFKILKLGKN